MATRPARSRFNNAALAAERLVRAGRRVLVFDPDVHHGNGTQNAFYGRGDVLNVSLHRWPFYPGTGSASETGGGTTVNVPLRAGSDDARYAQAMTDAVLSALARFRPDVAVISAGYDALARDPLGGMDLTVEGLASLWRTVTERCPAMAVLEGGYSLDALREGVAATAPLLVA